MLDKLVSGSIVSAGLDENVEVMAVFAFPAALETVVPTDFSCALNPLEVSAMDDVNGFDSAAVLLLNHERGELNDEQP
jgi:hypothetical protein